MKFKGKFRGTRGPTTDIDEQMPTINVTVSCTEFVGVYVSKLFRHNKLQVILFVKEKNF